MPAFDLVAPATEGEALAVLASGPAGSVGVLAGGTDLLLDVEAGRSRPRTLLSLRRLPWRDAVWERGGLRVGATRPLRDLERDEAVGRAFPALRAAIADVGGAALRRQATLGGNLGRAAPASDLLPVLLVLDAEVELVSAAGSRTLPVDRFLRASRRTNLRDGELIRSVLLPEGRPSAYLWQRVRPANDISQVSVAAAYSPSGGVWRIALGGVPPRPVLADDAARELHGAGPTPATIAAAAAKLAAHPALVSDRRATEEYRRDLVAVLLRRAVVQATAPSGASR